MSQNLAKTQIKAEKLRGKSLSSLIFCFTGVSGAGKTILLSEVFYRLKLKGEDIAVIPDLTHFSQIVTPQQNLFEGGGFEEYAYFYLFLDRLVWHLKAMHILLITKEHNQIFIDESPLTEYAVAKVRGTNPELLRIMEDLLKIIFDWYDRVYYVVPSYIQYKHQRKGVQFNKKKGMFSEAEKISQKWIKENYKEKTVFCQGIKDYQKIIQDYENLLCRG